MERRETKWGPIDEHLSLGQHIKKHMLSWPAREWHTQISRDLLQFLPGLTHCVHTEVFSLDENCFFGAYPTLADELTEQLERYPDALKNIKCIKYQFDRAAGTAMDVLNLIIRNSPNLRHFVVDVDEPDDEFDMDYANEMNVLIGMLPKDLISLAIKDLCISGVNLSRFAQLVELRLIGCLRDDDALAKGILLPSVKTLDISENDICTYAPNNHNDPARWGAIPITGPTGMQHVSSLLARMPNIEHTILDITCSDPVSQISYMAYGHYDEYANMCAGKDIFPYLFDQHESLITVDALDKDWWLNRRL
jgi:hypothetical protein